jgi:hypothetical protein
MSTDKYSIPKLQGAQNIALVFSLNRPKSYLDTVQLGLYDSQNRKLGILAFDQPQRLSQLFTTKVGGSNGDTIYYARMKTEATATIPQTSVQRGKIFYRLIVENGDDLRSEFSATTLNFARTTIPGELKVLTVAGSGVIPPDTFLVHASDTNQISINSPEKIYDYYLDSIRGLGPLRHVTFLDSTDGYHNYRTFKVDSPQNAAQDPYHFRLNVYKLQKDGAVYIDTIRIKAVY